METTQLGSEGGATTAVGFGAWAIGGLGYGDQDTGQAEEALDVYLQAGGRFIDTARGYGVSEILVGKALARHGLGGEVYLASKTGSTHPPIVRTDLEVSLHCLGVDCIDLYYIHVPPTAPDKLDALLGAYDQLKQAGKCRQIGVSLPNMHARPHHDLAQRILDDQRVDVVQIPHSFAGPDTAALIAQASDRGLGVVTRMNLYGGLLTGKYAPGHRFADADNDWRASLNGPHLDEVLQIVGDLAEALDKSLFGSLAQLALAYSLHTPGVDAIIPGARNAQQARANLAVAAAQAPPEAMRDRLGQAGRKIQALLTLARDSH